jgi:hypothetical protein
MAHFLFDTGHLLMEMFHLLMDMLHFLMEMPRFLLDMPRFLLDSCDAPVAERSARRACVRRGRSGDGITTGF